jgi:hypothetical protein
LATSSRASLFASAALPATLVCLLVDISSC